jgi:hypothetical protein
LKGRGILLEPALLRLDLEELPGEDVYKMIELPDVENGLIFVQ